MDWCPPGASPQRYSVAAVDGCNVKPLEGFRLLYFWPDLQFAGVAMQIFAPKSPLCVDLQFAQTTAIQTPLPPLHSDGLMAVDDDGVAVCGTRTGRDDQTINL